MTRAADVDGVPVQVISREGIGASQAAAAVGLDPFQPPIVLWQRLLGLSPSSAEETDALIWGRLLEQPIRRRYIETTGYTVHVPPESMFHPEHLWRRATPDGLVLDAEGRWLHGLEIKTASAFASQDWGPAGGDEVPLHYVCQVAWSMHVTGLSRWDLAVLIGGRDYRVYTIHRDLEFESFLVESVDSFWGHVAAQTAPPVDHTKQFRVWLERRWPEVTPTYLQADIVTNRLVEDILAQVRELGELERNVERDRNLLCSIIGEASGIDTDHGRVHWRPQRGRSYVNWEQVARDLGKRTTEAEFAALVQQHSKVSKASRALRLPRVTGREGE